VTLGAFVVVVGVILGFLFANRPRDTGPGIAGGPGRPDDPGIPRQQPKQQPPAPEKPPKEPETPAGKGQVPQAPPAAKEDKPKAGPPAALAKEIKNSLDMRLVLIPAGQFTMGSPPDRANRQEDKTPHEVVITKPFYLGAFEVTQAQYKEVMGNNRSYFSPTGNGKAKVQGLNTDAFPVEQVSWHDAVQFCERLSARAEEKRCGLTYRLPTEGEWEYACRGGPFSSPFHYGASLSSTQANFQILSVGAPKGPYLGRTTQVGSYEANRFGLFDMHGNVWEWCQDWYDKDYYRTSPRQDPQGPQNGTFRVLRGGSWRSFGSDCRADCRSWFAPTGRVLDIGFRVAAVPSGAQ
jgi:formylglycine-generating enzyme required for sulfatase activity